MMIKRFTTKITALALLLALLISSAISLTSCFGGVTPSDSSITEEQFASLSETLTASVDAGSTKKYSYVSSYLDYWGFPDFDDIKLKTIERYYNSQYLKDLGYDSSEKILELATRAARAYLETELPSLSLKDVNDTKGKNSDAIIRSYVSVLGDKYSYYRNSEEHRLYMSELEGEFAGIGVYVQLDYENNTITVLETLEESAAADAGILPGDLIVAVDGSYATEIGVDKLMNLIKGEIGTPVKVTVLRGGEEITYSMNRIQVEEKSVDYSVTDGIAYVVISSFNGNTDEQFIEIINRLEKLGGIKGYIFDLRYNGGGYLDTAVNLISHFIPKNVRIVSQVTRDNEYWHYSNSDHVISLPMVVLCNGYTASAGELFTAAIRDYRDVGMLNASIVGTTTYSKGQVQNIFPLNDGSSITLTIGLFNPPSGVNFDGIGIKPDVEVELIPDPESDNQYEAALAELQRLIAESNK